MHKHLGAGACALALFCAHAGAGEPEGNEFCPDAKYITRSAPAAPSEDLSGLLTREEKKHPGSLQSLFKKPGPYGHSELGFRFLARAFGYPGDFETAGAVERWLAGREAADPEFRGASGVWEKWVRQPDTFLRPGRASGEPTFAGFFRRPQDSSRFAHCLARDIAEMRCENYSGKEILPGARVYFGSATSRAPCVIHFNGGTLAGEPPDRINLSEAHKSHACNDSGGYCIDFATDRSWTWENPNQWDPSSTNGIKKSGNAAGAK